MERVSGGSWWIASAGFCSAVTELVCCDHLVRLPRFFSRVTKDMYSFLKEVLFIFPNAFFYKVSALNGVLSSDGSSCVRTLRRWRSLHRR